MYAIMDSFVVEETSPYSYHET
jgi:hypothetical protein